MRHEESDRILIGEWVQKSLWVSRGVRRISGARGVAFEAASLVVVPRFVFARASHRAEAKEWLAAAAA